jgi:hypothetical protein
MRAARVLGSLALLPLILATPSDAADGVAVIDRAISAGSDDAEERASDGRITLTSSDLELTTDGSKVQAVGLRFTSLAVPPGAAIARAYVQFRVDEASTGSASLRISGQSASNPGTFSTSRGDVSSRVRTSASVDWVPASWPTVGAAGADQRTPDLSEVIQEIVGLPGWASGNALVLVITGTGRRTAEAFEGTGAPVLHLEFTTGPPTNAPPSVDAGPDQTVVLPAAASLDGTVGDDGLPSPEAPSTTWSVVSGPAAVTFGDPAAVDTTASFSAPGTYVLRLTADDSELSASDELTVTVADGTTPVDEVHYTFTAPDSVTVDWRGGDGSISYGLTDAYGTQVQAHAPVPLPFSSTGPFWEAELAGLQPGTTYHYSIGDGPDRTFSTAPTGPFRFAFEADVGDSVSDPDVTAVQALIAADAPAFVLVGGDIAYADANGLGAVDQHFNDVMAWSTRAAYMPAWGNHEVAPPDDLRNYKGRFAIANQRASPGAPAAGCCGEDWGWFDAGGVRFISYPEPYSSATWSDWSAQVDPLMAAAQADPGLRFIVTFGHRPAYSTGSHAGSATLAAILDGLGDRYPKYVLNLNGHSHNYERFQPIHGVVHVTSGGGGHGVTSAWTGTDPRTAYRARHLQYLRLDVTEQTISVQAICGPPTSSDDIVCGLGSVIDAVTISADRNLSPMVNAGPDATVILPSVLELAGSVTDDGKPSPPGVTTSTWSVTSGPGPVVFADPAAVETTASFSVPGSYVLRLTADDSAAVGVDELTVSVSEAGAPVVVQRTVAASSDDAEQRGSGSMDLTSSDLELTTDGSTVQTVGIRFDDLPVPAGATITNAYVRFVVDEVSTGSAQLQIAAQAADDPPTFTSASGNISSRPRTSASVAWAPASWPTVGVAGPDQQTPDLSAVLQEVVGRPGWASGNAVVVVITGTGRRTAEAFDGSGGTVLVVEYATGVSAGNRPPVVSAGPDQAIVLPNQASLSGAVTDDGLPNPPGTVSHQWSAVSGPGVVTFGDPAALATTAAFSDPGSYVLRLTASDSELERSDDLMVTVTSPSAAPVILVPEDQPTIAAAVAAAPDGAIIDVAPGTYLETVTVDRSITIRGRVPDPADPRNNTTTLDGGGSTPITIAPGLSPGPTISGLQIRNGPDGIKVSSPATIEGNSFVGNGDHIDYSPGGGGVCRNNVFQGSSDDSVDVDHLLRDLTVEGNLILDSGDDGIEMRLQDDSIAVTAHAVFRGNQIVGSREDGIQLIDYYTLTNRVIRIEGNLIRNSTKAGIGLLDDAVTTEDFRAASILEPIRVINNTLVANDHGISGGDDLVAVNNILVGHVLGMKDVDGGSIASHNLFWNNLTDTVGSVVDASMVADPLLDAGYGLSAGSPAIDAGVARFDRNGEVVLDLPPGAYAGAAPDLGWRELV